MKWDIKWNDTMFADLDKLLNEVMEENRKRNVNSKSNNNNTYGSLNDNKIKESLSVRKIDKVIYNNPATIIFWNDNTKTVAKCEPNEKYDKEKGFMVAYLKKLIGNKDLHKMLEKYVWNEEYKEK